MASLAKSVLVKLWKTLVRVLGVLRRTLCCFRHRRRASDEGLPVYVLQDGLHSEVTAAPPFSGDDLQSWESWQDEPLSVTVEAAPVEPSEDDFFRDMVPTVQHQKKHLPQRNDSEEKCITSRLRMDPQLDVFQSTELGDLEESCGWEDVALDSALKEQRRAILEQRVALHQQRKLQMEQRKAQRDKRN